MQKVLDKMAPPGIRLSKSGILVIVVCCGLSLLYFATLFEPEPVVDMKMLLVASIDFAERGGDQVRKISESGNLGKSSKGETLEGADNPLTKGDMMSHRAIVQSFNISFPNIQVVSEEKDSAKVSDDEILPAPLSNAEVDRLVQDSFEEVKISDILVWVDPLDATQEYTEGLNQYVTTMVCVAVKGKPVIGVIHKPFERKTYWSWVNHGTNIQDESDRDSDKHSVIVSRSHKGDVEKTAKQALGNDVEIVPAGGAGYKTLALFNGKASVYVHTTLIKKWDICAGDAILRYAKGHMTTRAGDEIDYSTGAAPKNKGGLVAALHNHDVYVKKLGAL